jgi:hypothetical protein
MDGGISDNLALRVLLNDMLLMETQAERFTAGLMPVRRVLVISVDGQAAPNPAWPRQRAVSGLGQIVSAATGAQIGAYKLETLIAIEDTVDDIVEQLRQMRCRRGRIIMGYPCDDVAGQVMRVSLSDYDDPETRARLLAIRTGLTIPRDQVDELVAVGETMICRHAGAIAGFLAPGPRPPPRVAGDDHELRAVCAMGSTCHERRSAPGTRPPNRLRRAETSRVGPTLLFLLLFAENLQAGVPHSTAIRSVWRQWDRSWQLADDPNKCSQSEICYLDQAGPDLALGKGVRRRSRGLRPVSIVIDALALSLLTS